MLINYYCFSALADLAFLAQGLLRLLHHIAAVAFHVAVALLAAVAESESETNNSAVPRLWWTTHAQEPQSRKMPAKEPQSRKKHAQQEACAGAAVAEEG